MTIKRGDVFWYRFEGSCFSEQDGVRPCVIVSNSKANTHSPVVTIVPLTTAEKKMLPVHTAIWVNNKRNTVLCEQIVTAPKDRLLGYITSCTRAQMSRIDACLRNQLFMDEDW